jgi:23S rRNA pseudouridine2604 synthase
MELFLDQVEKIRLSKIMSERGLCSRREADDLISKGLVKVNGVIVSELGTRIDPHAKVDILAAGQKIMASKVTVILNKPIGFVSAQPENNYRSALELIRNENLAAGSRMQLKPQHNEGLGPAGRLDIDSQGLMIYTQDGVLARKIIGESSECEKEYLVRVQGVLSHEDLALLRFGLSLDEKPLKPAHVEWLNVDQLRFVLTEGRKRQIRRMCEAVGLRVTGLKRVRVGGLVLGNLPEGQWRFLEPEEYELLASPTKINISKPKPRRY